eukprot:3338795-Rhodomonas_salina.6
MPYALHHYQTVVAPYSLSVPNSRCTIYPASVAPYTLSRYQAPVAPYPIAVLQTRSATPYRTTTQLKSRPPIRPSDARGLHARCRVHCVSEHRVPSEVPNRTLLVPNSAEQTGGREDGEEGGREGGREEGRYFLFLLPTTLPTTGDTSHAQYRTFRSKRVGRPPQYPRTGFKRSKLVGRYYHTLGQYRTTRREIPGPASKPTRMVTCPGSSKRDVSTAHRVV